VALAAGVSATAARARGYTLMGDLSVVGFDDQVQIAGSLHP
jgi:DNA-binding LacI/PurR family transcriptional regulator